MKYYFTVLSLFSPSVFAGNNLIVVYSPASSPAASVPTLGGVFLLVLGILIATVAIRMMKQQHTGSTMALAALGISALLATSSGVKLMSDALCRRRFTHPTQQPARRNSEL